MDKSYNIEEIFNVIGETIASALPPPGWPFLIFEGDAYLDKYYWNHIYKSIKFAKNMGHNFERIANTFYNASRIVDLLASMYGLSHSTLTQEEKLELINDLFIFIKYFRKNDPYCRNGKNIILDDDQMIDIKEKVFYLTNNTNKQLYQDVIGKINGSLFALCDMIHVGIHFAGHEFHGPYLTDKGKIIVREYYDLKPVDIWNFSKYLNYEYIKTIELYDDVEINLDFFNHIRSSSSLPNNLKGLYIEAINYNKNEKLTLNNINDIFENISITIKEALEETKKYSKKDWIKKYVEIHYHYLRKCRELVGLNWRPSNNQYELLNEKPNKEVGLLFTKLKDTPREEIPNSIAKIYLDRIF